MKSNDPALLTIVMPTKGRPEFVGRALAFLAAQGFAGHVLCVDASDDADFARTRDQIAKVSTMDVTHYRPRARGNAWREIVEALETARSRYIQLHHDDDFYFLDEIERAIDVLENDSSVATAQGRFVYVEEEMPGGPVSLANHDRFQYSAEAPLERISDCMVRFAHLLYAVMRRTDFVAVLDRVQTRLDQGWFDQYAISILLAARGRAAISDALYGVRQVHAAQHHRNFLGPDAYKHWPLILAAPDFSATYAAFKSCLIDTIGPDVDTAELADRIDHGLVSLVSRAAGQLPEREAEDVALFERANRAGSPEHARLTDVVAAIRRAGRGAS